MESGKTVKSRGIGDALEVLEIMQYNLQYMTHQILKLKSLAPTTSEWSNVLPTKLWFI